MSHPYHASSRAEEAADSVLIVDHSAESRAVLRTVLEGRGMNIFEAERADDGLDIMRRRHPDVVVLDVDDAAPADDVREAFEQESENGTSSLVVLGRIPGHDATSHSQVIAKPYHYGPLIRTIEQLLAEG